MSDAELAVVEAEAELAKAHARNALAEWALVGMTDCSDEPLAATMQAKCNAACAAQDVVIAEARLKRARAIYDFSVKPER